MKAKKIVVVKHFEGFPLKENFMFVEEELPPLKDGEILVKAEWISVDPYQRLNPSNVGKPVPFEEASYQVGIVEESKNSEYPVGTRVVSHKGWRDYSVINPKEKGNEFGDMFYKLPDILGLSESHAVGALGMPGVTAYYGFLELCNPKPGETVVVTGAAGACGSIAGQIAQIKGCKVIGFTGSDDKAARLEMELGFDKAFNYKTVDVAQVLKQAAPNGIDCYFDNVGGEISSVIINHMNSFGRVSICGSISIYNEDMSRLPKATILQPALVSKQLKVEAFLVFRWNEKQWAEAIKELAKWVKTGQLKPAEHVTVGLENTVDAFLGLFSGDNFGKAVVKV